MFWERGTSGKYWVNSVGFTHFWLIGDAPVSLTWCWKCSLVNLNERELHISVTGAGFLGLYICVLHNIISTYILRQWDLQSAWNKRAASGKPKNLALNCGREYKFSVSQDFLGYEQDRVVLICLACGGVFVCFWLFFLVGCFECSLFSTSAIFNVITLEISAHWGRMS